LAVLYSLAAVKGMMLVPAAAAAWRLRYFLNCYLARPNQS
jgi:hypothetical protein